MSELLSQIRIAENRLETAHRVCTMCTRSEPSEPVRCVSLDCPWLFQRRKVERQAEDIEVLQELIQALELGNDTKLESLEDSDEELQDDGGRINAWEDID